MLENQGCRELPPRECYLLLIKEEDSPCFIIDVRTTKEFNEGHLEGAENIDYYRPDFRKCLETKVRTCRYLIYCKKGVRGHTTMELMRECGFTDVTNIGGGFENWASQGLPVKKR
jgi:rhodanese-related sulfurtransferase